MLRRSVLEILCDCHWNWEMEAQHKAYIAETHQNNGETGMSWDRLITGHLRVSWTLLPIKRDPGLPNSPTEELRRKDSHGERESN